MRTRFHWKAACACAAVIALALLACLSALAARAEADGMLRVKLARLGSPEAIRLSADCDYYLAEDPSVRIPANTEITVSARNGSLALSAGGRESPLGASAHLMRSAPGNSGISFLSPALSNRFCGDLYLSASGNVITTVLHIFVEDYLYGVVGCEMAPSSGIEALKAQAIVARNYALRQKTARAGSAYDLSDSGDALSFRGYNGIDATYAHYNPFDMIHARNVADETGGNGAMTVEKEQVTAWNPDILLINKEGPTLGILKSDFETNPDFYRELSAVQNGQVYGQLAYNCVYTNIELSLVNTYFAATVIYPEQFADVDFDAKADEILTMFLGENGPSFMDMMDEAGLSYQHFAMFD